jgi:hypothetical protein
VRLLNTYVNGTLGCIFNRDARHVAFCRNSDYATMYYQGERAIHWVVERQEWQMDDKRV